MVIELDIGRQGRLMVLREPGVLPCYLCTAIVDIRSVEEIFFDE